MDAPESPWGTSPYQQAVIEGNNGARLRWIAGAAIAVVLIAAGIGSYFWFTRAVALPVTVTIDGQPLVPGSTSDLTVTVHNGSQKDTALATEIAVTLPDKTTSAGLDNETPSSTIPVPVVSVGDIAPGESQTVKLILSTELDPSSAVPVSAAATYGTARDPQKRFAADTKTDLVVQQPALTLTVEAPQAVVRNAPFAATVRYRNNTDQAISGARLEVSIPRGLVIVSSTPALSSGVLMLPGIAAKGTGSISLSLSPGPSAPHEMPVRATVTSGQKSLAERTATVIVSSDALSVTASLKGRHEAAVSLDETISYEFLVKNLATIPLSDVAVKATLGGSLFQLSSVQAQGGSLSSKEPVVTWNGVGIAALRSIQPGDEVRLQLNVRLARTASGASLTAPVSVVATSPTVPPGTSATGVTASDSAVGKLAADTAFDASVFWRDPLGQIADAGPQPPVVGSKTQYVVRWTITPAHAALKEAVVTAQLAPGIRFTGKLGGVTASALTYDAGSGTVTWRPGAVGANTSAKAAFQVELTPAANQKGRNVNLVGTSNLSAADAFTGQAVRDTSAALTTLLQGNATGAGNGVVQ